MVLRGTAADLAVLAGGKHALNADWRAHQLLGRQSPDSMPERTIRLSQCGSWTQIVPEIQARPSPASALGLVAELSNAAPLRTMLTAIVRRGAFLGCQARLSFFLMACQKN